MVTMYLSKTCIWYQDPSENGALAFWFCQVWPKKRRSCRRLWNRDFDICDDCPLRDFPVFVLRVACHALTTSQAFALDQPRGKGLSCHDPNNLKMTCLSAESKKGFINAPGNRTKNASGSRIVVKARVFHCHVFLSKNLARPYFLLSILALEFHARPVLPVVPVYSLPWATLPVSLGNATA